MFVCRCPQCMAVREVRGRPNHTYETAADGALTRRCPSCARVGGRTPPLLKDAKWLAAAYMQAPATSIARDLGCSRSTVLRWLAVHEIPRRSKSEGQLMHYATRGEKRMFAGNRNPITGRGCAEGPLVPAPHDRLIG